MTSALSLAAMPYIDIPPIDLGVLKLQPFGILVASGVLLATWMGRKYAERNDLDEEVLRFLGIRLLIWGWLACHVFNTLFYEWDRFREEPLLMLKVWDGISSWGGVIGGTIAFLVYTRIKKLDRRRWADLCAYGAAGGWLLGRMACAVVHDHIGYPTSFWLAIDFPPHRYMFARGVNEAVRAHDLGLDEFLVLIPIFISMVLLERWKGRWPGFLLGYLALVYSVPRFCLEFLRRPETDPRYAGLTFAQYCCILAVAAGLFLLLKRPAGAVAAGGVEAGEPDEVVAAAATKKPRPSRPRGSKRSRRR